MRTISLSNQFMLVATFGLAFSAWGCQLSSGSSGAGGSSSGGSSGGGGTGGSSSTLTFDPTKPPCDNYAEDGGPCVAAHSTIRILSSAWAGKALYQVRVGGSNSGTGGTTQDILAGTNGFADSAAQGRDVDRDLLQPELLCRQQAHVARDDDPLGVHDDGLLPTEFFDAGGDLVDCLLRNLAGVARVGDQAINRPLDDFHVKPSGMNRLTC